ncbi:hypothetical protein AJ80_07124 [Polytolypa hystricis UAMH7299]|uniref:RBR-type E3 ubiquitin transferase n=1 Tax=Polytolypa hystricis (strain UAMH7299) TaxID=1447883 RepID=A0A2B7XI92_POLH7|nr:hypothetical protein AJ80_07124 [Polytolypa hystricis UAMH7299]
MATPTSPQRPVGSVPDVDMVEELGSLSNWPALVGLKNLEDMGERPLPWTEYRCPDELRAIKRDAHPELARIMHESLAVELYNNPQVKEEPKPATAQGLSPASHSPRSSILSPNRADNDAISQRSRSSFTASDNAYSPTAGTSYATSQISTQTGSSRLSFSLFSGGLKSRIREKNSFRECASCFDQILDKHLLSLNCQHKYCLRCFSKLVETSLTAERLFPPKCCLEEIPTKLILHNVDSNLRDKYKTKALEYAIPEPSRWYCPTATCGKWISASKIKKGAKTQKCPHCRTVICGTCRGLTHANSVDCPLDYGLEATLEEAEMHGWRRCIKCRAMVELTSGCRHITCQCGAEFCYTCGARWRTCACTEEDQTRRQLDIDSRRVERDQEAAREASELQAALEEIQRMEEEEARENLRREQEKQRQEEEEERAKEEEERTKEATRLMGIADQMRALQSSLMILNKSQQSLLIARHENRAHELHSSSISLSSEFEREMSTLSATLQVNIQRRMDALAASHVAELQDLTARQEEEEDDTFLSLARHLKGKPNREERERAIVEKLKVSQEKERIELEHKHRADKQELAHTGDMERQALGYGVVSKWETTLQESRNSLLSFVRVVSAERHWFNAVVRMRMKMLRDYRVELVTGQKQERKPLPSIPMEDEKPADSASVISSDASVKTRTTKKEVIYLGKKPERNQQSKKYVKQSALMMIMG